MSKKYKIQKNTFSGEYDFAMRDHHGYNEKSKSPQHKLLIHSLIKQLVLEEFWFFSVVMMISQSQNHWHLLIIRHTVLLWNYFYNRSFWSWFGCWKWSWILSGDGMLSKEKQHSLPPQKQYQQCISNIYLATTPSICCVSSS